MQMNFMESFVMNSFIRTWFLRHIEAPLLLELSGALDGMTILELGCGQGVGTELIFDLFKAQKILALDIDSKMVLRAQKRLSHIPDNRLGIQVGDATQIAARDGAFDAVFNFSALHHIPQWQKAVEEIARVVKPGGRFLFEEVTSQWIERWHNRLLFLHPRENRFSGKEFIDELERNGLAVGDRLRYKKNGDFVFGVAVRAAS